MGLVLMLVLLALVFGGVGLAVEAMRWLLIIGIILIVASMVSGWRSYHHHR